MSHPLLPFIHPTYAQDHAPLYRGVALVGLPRSGKTTVGKALAQQQQWSFIDSDAAIAQEQQILIPELIARDGTSAFRALEKEWLTQQCASPIKETGHEFVVLSTGGGMPCHNHLMERLKQHFLTVHLDLDLALWYERMHAPPHELTTRLDDVALGYLYQERSEVYAQAHYVLRQRSSVQADAKNILALLL